MMSTVTASSPLMVSDGGRRAVAAVVGLRMKYSAFYEHYVNATTSCGNCNFTCRSSVRPLIGLAASLSQSIKQAKFRRR